MGLTNSSVGINAIDSGVVVKTKCPTDKIIALAGNPNVGKSTVFNGLTGMNQHTGNWPGKTVSSAIGYCKAKNSSLVMVDLPGTYSLIAHSAEEEVARDFICFGKPDAVVVVCDAVCLERNLNLVLQTMEISDNVIVCVNLMDEAEKKHIRINLDLLSKRLKIPVIGIVARKKRDLSELIVLIDKTLAKKGNQSDEMYKIKYPEVIEEAISEIENSLQNRLPKDLNSRWLSLKILENDKKLLQKVSTYLKDNASCNGSIDSLSKEYDKILSKAQNLLSQNNIDANKFKDIIVSAIVKSAEKICSGAVEYKKSKYSNFDRRTDKILTGRLTGYPIMICFLAFIFWLTITGANYPSKLLSQGLFYIQDQLTYLFNFLGAPSWLHGALVLGVYRVLAWVVSVMLPPMAIFFPLFTLLEDSGYLPRIAYNLDKPFKKCCACGKQALTMCMGFGCNAAGIVGCRIIDSPRERLLAILTNNFVPCNGRFPTIITILSMFFVGAASGAVSNLLSAVLLTAVIVMGILATFLITKLLSKTILKGIPSSFTLELPPYRTPQFSKVIVRSIFDRTIFVLGRAVAVAAPAGLIIWILANVKIGNLSVLNICANFLDPFAKLMGLDGILLMAFILGFPANEIVIPIAIMAYTAKGCLTETGNIMQMRELFVNNGWTFITALNTIIFSLMHWPCSTTLLTIKKETGSLKWTVLAAVIPTFTGILICIITNFFATCIF